MLPAIGSSLIISLPFCLILFATMGLPPYMSIVYVAAGIAGCLIYRR